MSRNLNLPYLPVPPNEYDARYFREILRSISTFMNNTRNPGEGRNTTIVLTNLQQHDQNLEPGTVFQQDGILKVVLPYKPHPAGNQATANVGNVTVSIS